ncbi:cytochrome P450 [Aspergillus ambiguus]|uniref:cytochrome P450 n=1 Tax=Aspergillus ambiguus TaxID=176160 RepID=UPI003CCCB8CC
MALTLISSLVFCLVVLCVFNKVVYNLYFHPLARFPGPSLWCASRIPFLWKMLRGELPRKIKAYHDKYGPVVRVAPDELSFDDPAAWKDIYLNQTLDRLSQLQSRATGSSVDDVLTSPIRIHPNVQEISGPAFSEASTDSYEPIVVQAVEKLIASLKSSISTKEHDNSALDIVKWLKLASFDIAAEIIWGSGFGCLESGQGNIVLEYAFSYREKMPPTAIAFYPFSGFFSHLLSLLDTRSTAVHELCRRKAAERLSRQRETLPAQQDQLDNDITITEIEQASIQAIMANSGPIAAVLAGTLNYLLRNPSKHDKLVQEIRGSFNSEAEINGDTTRSLSYLHAVVMEGLRIAPPVPDGLRRRVPADGLVVAGCSVPSKTTVSTGCWVQFMNPRNFACPSEFVPERWLHAKGAGGTGGRTIIDTANQEAFYPFGLGSRRNFGEPLAWLELKLTLAKLLWNFDISIPPGKQLPAWPEQNVFWFWDVQPMEVSLGLHRRFQ